MAEVDKEAKEYIDLAKSTIDKECLSLRTQAAQEAQRILGQVELMKTAVQEELETQKIYTDAARSKTNCCRNCGLYKATRIIRMEAKRTESRPAPSEQGSTGVHARADGADGKWRHR